jgi:hypothetical protein
MYLKGDRAKRMELELANWRKLYKARAIESGRVYGLVSLHRESIRREGSIYKSHRNGMAIKQPKAAAPTTLPGPPLRCGAEELKEDVEGRRDEAALVEVKVKIPSSSVEVMRGRFVLLVSMLVVCVGNDVKVIVVSSEPPLPPPP